MNGYKIVSELLTGNPNVDMLVIKPYLYVYAPNEKMDHVRENGLGTGDDGVIKALFTRLPENSYGEYLSKHFPIKISASKLAKAKYQDIQIKPVNFEYEKDNLKDEDIEKIMKKHSKKLTAMIQNGSQISSLPRVDIIPSKGTIPAFCLKVLDIDRPE